MRLPKQQKNSQKPSMKTFPNKKTNREDIRAIAEHSQEMFDYLIHVCNVLADPPSYDIHEREMKGFKKD